MNLIEAAKDEVTDEGVFTAEQQYALCAMLDRLKPLADVPAYRRANWPWETGHPWRRNIGRWFWRTGYWLMHGVKMK